MFEKHFGRNDSATVLVVNGATTTMNPTISQAVIDAAYEDDPIAAAAEYGAEFRRDVEVFLPAEALDAVRDGRGASSSRSPRRTRARYRRRSSTRRAAPGRTR